MPTTFDKLNLKDQSEIIVIAAPESFEPELKRLRQAKVLRDLGRADGLKFVLAFVTKQSEVDALCPAIAKQAEADAVVWFAYPKGTSKKYNSEISRDHGWDRLRELGFDTVRAVAIDEDWSALRFRRVAFIKSYDRRQRASVQRAGPDPHKERKSNPTRS